MHAANDQLQLDNDGLMSENARLHAEVATLRTRNSPRMTPPLSSIYEMPTVPEPRAFNPRVDNLTENPAAKHLAARLRDNAPNRFTTAEEMLAVLQTAYGDTDKKHTARVKFQELRMTTDFGSFWAEFQVLASELKSHESTLIIEMQQKLTLALSRALAALPKPTNLQVYARAVPKMPTGISRIWIKRTNRTTASSSRYGAWWKY